MTKTRGLRYVIDVTDFQGSDSYSGYPKETLQEKEAFELFHAAVTELDQAGEIGTFTVRLSTKTPSGETTMGTLLVNKQRS